LDISYNKIKAMSKEKDLLEIYKERIKKESKRGDKAEAIRRAGVTQGTYDAGFKKEKIDELTIKELDTLGAHIDVLNERKEELRKREEQYAN